MEMVKEITTRDDISLLVTKFYLKVRKNPFIFPWKYEFHQLLFNVHFITIEM